MDGIDPAICVTASRWFADNARDLPWRAPDRSPWGVLVSEVMLAQTPVSRVAPVWSGWVQRWPDPTAQANASRADVIREWGRLGYPRRALALHASAVMIVEHHHGAVPETVDQLLTLPGVGPYTARAVAAFGFGAREPVIDVNVARVLARAVDGQSRPSAPIRRADLDRLSGALPTRAAEAVRSCAGLMELGALVCTAKSPACGECPLQRNCHWFEIGRPQPTGAPVRTQAWSGTDRQCRGTIMAALRDAAKPVGRSHIDALWPDAPQLRRCIDSLIADGLAHRSRDGSVQLPT